MFTSSADVFRSRQVLRDLTEAVRINNDAMLCLGTTGAEKEAITRIAESGFIIDKSGDDRAYTQLLLSAALPEEDFGMFLAATLILLIDLLKQGDGPDDLFWNWEAFQDHYRLADPPVRAALMNGFRLAQNGGRVNIGVDLRDEDCLTLELDDVLTMIEGDESLGVTQAIRDKVDAATAGALWDQAAQEAMTWQALTGFRYLYERSQSLAPASGQDAAMIPWV